MSLLTARFNDRGLLLQLLPNADVVNAEATGVEALDDSFDSLLKVTTSAGIDFLCKFVVFTGQASIPVVPRWAAPFLAATGMVRL